MVNFNCELDAEANTVKVEVVDDEGAKSGYRFDFDPRSGSYDCEQRDQLEARVGGEWIDRLEAHVRKLIGEAVMARRRAERDDPWGA